MIRYFLHNGIAVSVLCLAIMIFGVLAIISLPIQLTPNVQTPAITVSTIYPGATPRDVEQDILAEQEKFLRSVEGLTKMTSTASQSRGEIILEFPVGSDMSDKLLRVNNALAQVPSYPENVDEPSLSTSSSSDQPVAWFSIRALPGMETEIDIAAQFDYADDFIKPAFERIPGVASVQGVYGGSEREMQVFLDPFKLAERGLTIYQVRTAIRDNNRDVPGGSLNEGKRSYIVRTTGRYRTPQDVENTIITIREDGTPIRIRDVGYAQIGIAEKQSLIRHNGRPAMAMGVRHQPGTNLLIVMDDVKRVAQELNDGPLKDRGLFLTQVTDDTEYVSAATLMVRNNLLLGGVLALLTLFLFLRHLRPSLVVSLAVPVCLFGSLFLINGSGRSINVISLAGLAFSVGAILDNSIVVLENIFRHRELGKSEFEAADHGVHEVWTAILSATVTNVVVFAPIITLQEEAGQLFRDLAIAITSTNIFSFIVAVLVIPALAARWLGHVPTAEERKRGLAVKESNLLGIVTLAQGFYAQLEKLLVWLMGGLLRRVAVVAGIVLFAAALVFVLMPKTEYLPEGNQNSIFAMLIPPQGYSIEEMSSIGRELEVRFRPYVETSHEEWASGKTDLIGPPMQDFFFVSFSGSMFMFTRAKNAAYASEIPPLLTTILSDVPGTFAIAVQRSIFDSSLAGSRGIELDIVGTDMAVATGVAAQAFVKAMQVFGSPPQPEPGIEVGQPELTILPRWERAAELGLGAIDIGYGAWVLGDGAFADDFYEDGKKRDLYLYSTLGAFDTLANFDTLRIATTAGDTVPLSEVAEVQFNFVPQQIRRLNQERSVTLNIIPPANISLEEAIEKIQTEIVGELMNEGAVPPGYRLRIGGSSDKLAAVRETLATDMMLAILLVYLVLVLIFKHWGHPFTILMSVPIGLTGGVLGLKFLNIYFQGLGLTGLLRGEVPIQSLDVLTMLGFIILLGSVVNNPILIVEQSLNFFKSGLTMKEAIVASTMSRIRPIFMTTGTTMLGLAPLVFLPGAGSELYRGLGVVMFGGLLFGTVTTIFFIPSVMSLMYDLTDRFKKSEVGQLSETFLHKLKEDEA